MGGPPTEEPSREPGEQLPPALGSARQLNGGGRAVLRGAVAAARGPPQLRGRTRRLCRRPWVCASSGRWPRLVCGAAARIVFVPV